MKFKDVKPEVYGIIFGIFSLALGYFLLEFAIAVFHSGAVQAYIQKLASGEADLLPIPVFMALVLFVAREILDSIKKRKAELRKIKAYKQLIAEELELNYGAYLSLKGIFSELEEKKEEWDGGIYEAKFKEAGNLYVHVTHDDRLVMASLARKPSMVQHDKILVNVAELDISFYEKLRCGYLKVIELNHLYDSLIKGLKASDFDEPFPHTITKSGFLGYALNECERIYSELNDLYLFCTGRKLKKSRLR